MSSEAEELEKEATKENTEVKEQSGNVDEPPAKRAAVVTTEGVTDDTTEGVTVATTEGVTVATTEGATLGTKVQSWTGSYRRVIAILPGTGNKGTLYNDMESSDDEISDTRSEGVLETSSSSSEMNDGIPAPTKPKVLIKRSETDQTQASH